MRPALGEKAQAGPLFAGESSFVADVPHCAREGLAPENMVSLLASTVIMGDTRDAVVIVPVAYRLLQKPERANCWTGSWRGFGSRRLGARRIWTFWRTRSVLRLRRTLRDGRAESAKVLQGRLKR